MKEFLTNLVFLVPIILSVFIAARRGKPWSALSEQERRQRIFLIILGIILFVGGIVAFFLFNKRNSGEGAFSQEQALVIAQDSSECSMAGVLTDEIIYNTVTKSWWIDLERMPELEKDGCNPACVVDEMTKTAEVNWRCTGLVEPE